MAHVTDPLSPAAPEQPAAARPSATRLVDQQIHRTRRALKIMDAATGLITLTIGVLIYLLCVALLEHWVLPGGWSPTARSVLLGILLLGSSWYSLRIFWPLWRQSINPAYAAQAIEQSSPSLKNSLLNLLLLRGRRQQLPQRVYQAIEQQAAQRLSQVPRDTSIDRSTILRLGYILAGVIACSTLYGIASPKDPLASMARVLLPWSPIAVPSRVQILDITPGDTSLARGEQLTITAEILGLEETENAAVVYTTRDQQQVAQRQLLTATGLDYVGQLPAPRTRGETIGIAQDLTYWIEAGDARSPRYQVSVFAKPTLVVHKLRYDYPAYTGYASREVQHTGDIRALVGTRVTIVATANKPIAQAHVDFAADGRHDLSMQADGQQARVTFPLELNGATPPYQNYVLRYETMDGRHNRSPPQYQIDVIPDYSPEIQLLRPTEALRKVTLEEQIEFQIEARDPDFAVQHVRLLGTMAGQQVVSESLLSQNHQGRFVGQLRKTPAELGLQVGDTLEYWATAADNRRPTANRTATARQRLQVVDANPAARDPAADSPPQNSPPDAKDTEPAENSRSEPAANDRAQGEGEQGEGEQGGAEGGGAGNDTSGESGSASTESPADNGAGGAGQSEQSPAGEGESPAAGSSGKGAGPAADQQRPAQHGDQSPDTAPRPGKVSPDGDDDGTAFQRITEHFDQQDNRGEPAGAEPANERPTDDGQAGEERARDEQAGSGPAPNEPPGAEPASERRAGDKPARDEQANDEQAGNEQTSSEPAADGQTSKSPAGDEPARDEQVNDGQTGDGPAENEPSPNSPRGADQPSTGPTDQQSQRADPPQTAAADASQNSGAGDTANAAAETTPEAQPPGTSAGGSAGRDESTNPSARPGDRDASEPSPSNANRAPETQTPRDTAGTGESRPQNAAQQPQPDRSASGSADDASGDPSESGAADADPSAAGNPRAAGDQSASGPNTTEQRPGEQAAQNQTGDTEPSGTAEDAQPSGDASTAGPAPSGTLGNTTEQSADPPATNSENSSAAPGGGAAPAPPAGEIMPGDAANLDYARQQTDLVLERLEEQLQKNSVDQQLLDKLGWNQTELQQFLDRWKNLKAETADPADSSVWDAALRSLGLSPQRRSGFQSQTATDQLRDLKDAYRGRTPLEYQDRVRAYIKGTATDPQPKITNQP